MSTVTRERPKVGVGVFVTSSDHPNCVLLGKRKNSSGEGLYALPGGHLEFGVGCRDWYGSPSFIPTETGIGSSLIYPVGCHPDRMNPILGEEWIECGARETHEETGLTLRNMFFATVVNCIIKEEHIHYVDLFVCGEMDKSFQSVPIAKEPDKCEGWEWFDWDKFPPGDQLFCPLRIVREEGYNPFTALKLKAKEKNT